MSDNRYLSDSVSESRFVDAVSSQMSLGRHDSLMVLTSFIRAEYDLAVDQIYKTDVILLLGSIISPHAQFHVAKQTFTTHTLVVT